MACNCYIAKREDRGKQQKLDILFHFLQKLCAKMKKIINYFQYYMTLEVEHTSFIFQTKYFETLKKEGVVRWIASKHRDQMRKGSIVYFWFANKNRELRGIYGWGVITADAPKLDDEEIYRIAVQHKRSFLDHKKRKHISIDEIEKDPVLKDLLIMRMAIGTNFLLTYEEDQAIRAIIARNYGKEWLPPVPGGLGRNGS